MTQSPANPEKLNFQEFEEVDISGRLGKEFINGVLDASLDGIFVCSAIRSNDGTIEDLLMLRINPAFTRIRKLDRKEVIGNRYLSIFPTAKDIGMFDFYCQVIESGVAGRKEFHYLGNDIDAWFEVSAVRLGKESLVVTFHDFTDFKKLQFELEQSIQKLETSNRNLEYFAFASSHDLKEPLRKVLLFSDQLKRRYSNLLDGEGINILSRMEAGIQRMTDLVDDLLVYYETSLNRSESKPVDLNNVMQEVLLDLELHFLEKNASITLDTLPIIKGNRRQLYELFLNLIENSLKFSIKDKPVKIEVSSNKVTGKDADIVLPASEALKSFFQIRIIDNGVGFDVHYVDRIFNVFQRLNVNFPGTGLGLSIAQKVMENHHGWIKASSEEGKGTVVTLLLPSS
jgi:signal transduction histidine kinase